MSNVTFRIGELGPFDGMLMENIVGHEYILKFQDVTAAPEHFEGFDHVTISRAGQPDLYLQGTGTASVETKDAGRTTSGEIPLRRK